MTTPVLVSHASRKSYRLAFNDKYRSFLGPNRCSLPTYRRDRGDTPQHGLEKLTPLYDDIVSEECFRHQSLRR